MSATRPNPLTPPDLDLSALEYMPLHVERLKRSVAWIKAKRNPELGFYLINLWTSAYMQTPAASLPDDDDLLCDAAMCEPKRWPKVKEAAMRGFVLCSDGRWYHRFVSDIAHDALEKRIKWRNKKRRQRGGPGGETPDIPQGVSRDTIGDKGGAGALRDGTGRDKIEDEEDARAKPPADDGLTIPAALRRDQFNSPMGLDPGIRAIRNACMAKIVEHFPDLNRDLRAYPGLTGSLGTVDSWIGDGADLERDVLPVIDATCIRLKAKNDKPYSFGLFTQGVANAKARNSAPLPESTDGQRASTERPGKLSAGQRTLVEIAAILAPLPGGPDRPRDGESEPGIVVDAEPVAVAR